MAVYAPISSTSTFTSNSDGLLSSKLEGPEFADSHIDSGSIKSILCSLFDECETPYETTPYDSDLHALCLKEAALKGYPIGDGPDDIHPKRYLPGGVILASAAYGHLPRGHQVFIALYTAIVVWFDDRYAEGKDLHGVERFHERFLTKQKQETVGLDAMAAIMWDISTYWGSVQANVILISTLKYITGELLECKIKGMKLSSNFKSFSTYLRSLTGISEAYAMFVFPQEMGIWKYMQAMPDICKYIDGYNDVVSFYKEEKAKEVNNFITLEAASLNEDKMVVLERLAVDIGACSRRIDQVLGEHQDALEAFRAFKRGGLLFHTSLESRYRLGELFTSS